MSEISKSARIELRRIVKGRFEVLREQMQTRAQEVKRALRQQIEADHQTALKEAEKEGAKLAKEARALQRKIETYQSRFKAKGLTTGHGDYYSPEKSMTEVVEYWTQGWAISSIDDKVKQAFERMEAEKGVADLDLKSKEYEILENLSLEALDSPQAKQFLETVPKVDDYLPLPAKADLKQLIAA